MLDAVVEILELGEEERGLFERVLQGRRPFEPVPIMYELSEEQIARIAVNQFRCRASRWRRSWSVIIRRGRISPIR